MMNAVFALRNQEGPQTLTTTPPAGQGGMGLGGLEDVLSTIPSLYNAASMVDAGWGDIQALDGQQEPPPQPTQSSFSGPEKTGMSIMGIGATGFLIGGAVGAGIYFAGGNIAWALVGAVLAAILAAYLMG